MSSASQASQGPKPFLTKLFKMVDDPDTNNIVSWTPAGDALAVHDDEAFAQQLLPHYFKHNNFSSFVRQLNTYGFSKVTAAEGPDRWVFAHLHFRRDDRDQINLIQRKSSHRASTSSSAAPAAAAPSAELDTLDFGPLAAVPVSGAAGSSSVSTGATGAETLDVPMQEETMRAELDAIRGVHANMTSRIHELNSQLQQTKAQQANTRESVNKIMAFLSQVYHSNRPQAAASGAIGLEAQQLVSSAEEVGQEGREGTAETQTKRRRLDETTSATLMLQDTPMTSSKGGGSVKLEELGEIPVAPFDSLPPLASTAEGALTPEPALIHRATSLGEEAASRLPDYLQDVALELVRDPELQDAALQRVQSGFSEGQVAQVAEAEDLEAFLWDFLEANQDNVELRENGTEAADTTSDTAATAAT